MLTDTYARLQMLTRTTCAFRIQSFNEYIENKIKGTKITFIDIHAASLALR